jgi:hypothetical protein
MAKENRTLEIFSDNLDDELGWRRQELLILKNKIPVQKNIEQNTLLRANYAILYAHWEGFIKSISENYIDYVKLRRLNLQDLKPCFIARIIRSKGSNETRINQDIIKIEFLIDKLTSRAHFTDTTVSTKFNLSFVVFKDILKEIGLKIQDIEPIIDYKATSKNNQVNVKRIETENDSLVKIRNDVAHGKKLVEMTYDDFIGKWNIIILFMQNVKEKLYQAALKEKYKN